MRNAMLIHRRTNHIKCKRSFLKKKNDHYVQKKSFSQKSAELSQKDATLWFSLYMSMCVYIYIYLYEFFFHNTNQEDDLLYIQHMNLQYSTSMCNHLIAPYSNSWNTHFLLLRYSEGIINRTGLCFKALLTCYAQIWTMILYFSCIIARWRVAAAAAGFLSDISFTSERHFSRRPLATCRHQPLCLVCMFFCGLVSNYDPELLDKTADFKRFCSVSAWKRPRGNEKLCCFSEWTMWRMELCVQATHLHVRSSETHEGRRWLW